MAAIIQKELKHIPKGDGRTHRWLRNYYNRRRMQGLSKGETKEETMRRCVKEIEKDTGCIPEFDLAYFGFKL